MRSRSTNMRNIESLQSFSLLRKFSSRWYRDIGRPMKSPNSWEYSPSLNSFGNGPSNPVIWKCQSLSIQLFLYNELSAVYMETLSSLMEYKVTSHLVQDFLLWLAHEEWFPQVALSQQASQTPHINLQVTCCINLPLREKLLTKQGIILLRTKIYTSNFQYIPK